MQDAVYIRMANTGEFPKLFIRQRGGSVVWSEGGRHHTTPMAPLHIALPLLWEKARLKYAQEAQWVLNDTRLGGVPDKEARNAEE